MASGSHWRCSFAPWQRRSSEIGRRFWWSSAVPIERLACFADRFSEVCHDVEVKMLKCHDVDVKIPWCLRWFSQLGMGFVWASYMFGGGYSILMYFMFYDMATDQKRFYHNWRGLNIHLPAYSHVRPKGARVWSPFSRGFRRMKSLMPFMSMANAVRAALTQMGLLQHSKWNRCCLRII